MTRPLALLLAAAPLLLAAASAKVAPVETIDQRLQQVRAEAAAAEQQVEQLEQAASKARSEAEKLAAERQAAAAAIALAEARLSEADTELRLIEARVALREARLAQRQAPVAALLAGIVAMGRRPPLLGIADESSLAEFIRVRALLDTTLPVIRARSAALSAELATGRRLQDQARLARSGLAESRAELAERQDRFAALEAQAMERVASLSAGALGAGDVMLARSSQGEELQGEQQQRRAARRLAGELALLPPAPQRPFAAPRAEPPPLAYRLPVAAPVSEGFGAIDDNGIAARGITLASAAGTPVLVPADGTVAFAGPFRRYDGIVILDHGGGWMSLLIGVRTPLARGAKVRLGDPLGRALGPVTVELSTNGRHVSAALIAGSSQIMSNGGKGG